MTTGTLAGLIAGAAMLLGGAALARAQKGGTADTAPGRPPWFDYAVQPGDTLSALSLSFFGDAKQWPSLLTGQVDHFGVADVLPVGTVLRVPCSWHVVQPGDSLSSLARAYLRNPERWKRIYRANQATIRDPNVLSAGMVLAIPRSAAALPLSVPQQVRHDADHPLDAVGALSCE